MFIGNNELHLNQLTMIDALQDYLNSLFEQKAPKVLAIDYSNNIFVVKLEGSQEVKS